MANLETWKQQLLTEGANVIFDGKDDFHSFQGTKEQLRGEFQLFQEDVKCASITFKDISFDDVKLFGIVLERGLHFIGCDFDSIMIDHCRIGKKTTLLGERLSFQDCRISRALRIDRCELIGASIEVVGTDSESFSMSDCSIDSQKHSALVLVSCSFSDIKLFRVKTEYDIAFTHVDVTRASDLPDPGVEIQRCIVKSLGFYDCRLPRLRLTDQSAAMDMMVSKTECESFNLRQSAAMYTLVVKDSQFTSFLVDMMQSRKQQLGKATGVIRIYDSDLGKNASIYGDGDYELLQELTISGTRNGITDLYVNNLTVKIVHLLYEGMIASLHVKKVWINKLEMNMVNTGKLKFSFVHPYGKKGAWTIRDSQTGSWQLYNCSFTGLEYLQVANSDLSGLRFAAVDWFSSRMLIDPEVRKTVTRMSNFRRRLSLLVKNRPSNDPELASARNARELYRQLKEAAENQKDRIQSLAFLREEMRAYEEELRMTRRFYHPDRLALWAGRSNDHGQNWWWPVFWALGITIVFWIVIVPGLDPAISAKDLFSPGRAGEAWRSVAQHWGLIPRLLNPVHSLENMAPDPAAIHPLTYWLDYLLRIITAFFIFQVVSAFRKFIKT